MVFKRYVKKNGKTHGPYYYESYREDGKVKHRFLGTKDPQQRQMVALQILLVSVFFLAVFFVFSFSGSITGFVVYEDSTNWNKTYSGVDGEQERGLDIFVFNDSVYVVGEWTFDFDNGGTDWWIYKFYSNGTEIITGWNKTYDTGDGNNDVAKDVEVDSEGNVYVAGDYHVVPDSQDSVLIKKFTAAGVEDTTSWNITINPKGNRDNLNSMVIDSNGNVYIGLTSNNFVGATTGFDWSIRKFNSSGTENESAWNLSFTGSPSGVSTSDVITGMAIDSNDNLYVVGSIINYSGAATHTNRDWVIKKFFSNGTEDADNWNYSFSSGPWDDEPSSVAVDSSDNLYVVGLVYNLSNGSSYGDWLIKKFDSSGNEDLTWNITVSHKYSNAMFDSPSEVFVDGSDNIYVAGYGTNLADASSGTDGWIKKFSSAGVEDTTDWNLSVDYGGGTDQLDGFYVDSNNSVYATGYASNIVSATSSTDLWITKWDFNASNPPIVTIQNPIATTYTLNSQLDLVVNINEAGVCEYSLDSGITNVTLTANASETSFTATVNFVNGSYNLNAYCNNTAGDMNNSAVVNFSINTPAAGNSEPVGSPPSDGGGDESLEGEISEAVCEEVWVCEDWEECLGGISTRICEDLAECGTDSGKPSETQVCESEVCVPSFSCGEWSDCNFIGDVGDILSGDITTTGSRTRTCSDDGGCLDSYIENEECSVSIVPPADDGGGDEPVIVPELEITIVTTPSGESSLVTRNSITGNPTSRISVDALLEGRLEIAFVQDEDKYPKHCFDAVMNEDEVGVDCGGSCNYCGSNERIFSMYPWIVFGLLVSMLAGGMSLKSLDLARRKKVEKLLESGSDLLTSAELTGSHDNLKDAMEHYDLLKKNFSKLGKNNRGLVRGDVEIFRKGLNKQIGRHNRPAYRQMKEDREERMKKFLDKRK